MILPSRARSRYPAASAEEGAVGNPLILILVVLAIIAFAGGGLHWGSPYGYSGIGLGTILIIVLLVLLLR
jgi:hypothetical protein